MMLLQVNDFVFFETQQQYWFVLLGRAKCFTGPGLFDRSLLEIPFFSLLDSCKPNLTLYVFFPEDV